MRSPSTPFVSAISPLAQLMVSTLRPTHGILPSRPLGRSFFSSSVSRSSVRSAASLPFFAFLATALMAWARQGDHPQDATDLALGGLELVARVETAVVGVLEVVAKVAREPNLLDRADRLERLDERTIGQQVGRQAGDEHGTGLEVARRGLGQQPLVAESGELGGLAADEEEDPD